MPNRVLTVTKRNGRIEPLDITKIQKYTKEAVEGLDNVSQSELELDARIQFRDGISTEEIQQTLIKTAVDKIDVDKPDWTFVAARLFLYDLYHKVGRNIGGEKGNPYPSFRKYFETGEKEGRIVKGLKEKFDIDELESYLKPERDMQFTYLGVKTLHDRYLLKNKEGSPIELPQYMFMAIAMFLAQNEFDKMSWAKRFYDLISKFEVMLATPTLSNARTPRHQLSSCYIGSTPDNIEGIFDGFKEMALLSKFGGGIGWDWCKVRGIGSSIDGHKNAAGGIIPFLKIANDVAIAVDQLGTRKGAIAVYVEPWHIDIADFLDLRKNSGEERRRAHDLFPALWINDLFMKRVINNERWTLFDPLDVQDLTDVWGKEFEKRYIAYENDDTIIKESVNAKDLWKKVLLSYFETGMPFLCFKDNANKVNPNPHSGIIRSSNLCVTGDTRLHTQFGMLKAKDLYEMNKKIIATYDKRVDGDKDSYGVDTAECIEMKKTAQNAKIYEIKTKDGYKIKSTDWHEYYVNRDGRIIKIPLNKINKESDKLLIQSDEGQFGKDGFYELGLIAGFVTGDGTFSISREKRQQIHIDLYNDDIDSSKDSIIDALSKIETYFKVHTKQKEEPKEFWHTNNSRKIRISSINVGEILRKNFDFTKDTKLRVPEFVFRGTRECNIGYLKGLFTSDATINYIKNDNIPTFAIQLGSISKTLLEEVQILLANFGIRSKISKMREAQDDAFEYQTISGELKKYNSKEFYRLNINGHNATKYIDEIGFIGVRQKKANEIIQKRIELGYKKEGRKKEHFETEILEINFISEEDVYDTTQLLNHSLIFNGLVTGNCTEIFQNTDPNHYLIKLKFEDGTVKTYEEEDEVKVDGDIVKKAKKLTALDAIDSKRVFIVEKEKIDGKTAVCNLASINLSKINTKENIERIMPIAIRMLDNVIELNFYPLEKVKQTNLKSRSIGLGVMGEAQMLAQNRIEWGSDEHFEKIDEIMEMVSYNAIKASSNLALEKGKYPEFEGSNWSKGIFPIDLANEEAKKLTPNRGGLFGYVYDWDKLREKVKKDGMRNGYLMAIAPTSSISILVGTTQTIEPIYKKKWFEENLSGLIPVCAPNLNIDTWRYYTPAYDLDQKLLVKAGAVRQKWIDQGQSLNIFMKLENATGKYLHEIYSLAWKLGIKSTYYLRSQSPQNEQDIADRTGECLSCQ